MKTATKTKNLTSTRNLTPVRIQRAAELMGTSTAALRQQIARGLVPFRRLGRRLYFFEEEIIEFLDRQEGKRPEEIKMKLP